MPIGTLRDKTLYGLGAKRAKLHRYTVIRWIVAVVSTTAVALLPLTGTLRIDLWSGRNFWLGEHVGLVEAVKAFAFPFLAVNVAIVLTSRFLGRWLCGFVCPIGNLNRLAEWFRWRSRNGVGRVTGALALAAACFLLAAITFSFWIDWRVFRDGSQAAVIVAASFLVGTTVVLYLTVQRLGMRFCRDFCPSGVYFAVLGPDTFTGVEFAHPESCTDCRACESACPVDLTPRAIAGATRPGTGFYPDGLSNDANCLRCGDCVAVCEATTDVNPGPTPLRIGPLSEEARTERAAP